MGVPTQSGFDLFGTYVHLGATGEAPAVEGGDEFWRLPATELDRKFGGWLVSAYHMTGDTRAWETHPSGDELLYLLSGAIDVVLEMDDGERTIELRAGSACVVPRGRWHRQIVRSPGDILSNLRQGDAAPPGLERGGLEMPDQEKVLRTAFVVGAVTDALAIAPMIVPGLAKLL